MRRPGQILMSAAIITSGIFGVYGALETSWSFDRDGLVGIALDIGDEGSDLTNYSIWNVGLWLWKVSLGAGKREKDGMALTKTCQLT